MVGEVAITVLPEAVPEEEQGCPVHPEGRTGPGRRPKGCRCKAERVAA
jgi:hypothetical protein